MSLIDTTWWGSFRVGDFGIGRSKPYHVKDLTFASFSDETTINYVTRSKFNNGITDIVFKEKGLQTNPAGVISFGAENADFFYQKEEYVAGNKMYYINTQNLSEDSALFLKTILQATFTNNFSFSDGLIPSRIENEYIKLPITTDGLPDWEYMDHFIKEKKGIISKYIENTSLVKRNERNIDVSKWGEYQIDKIFPKIKRPATRKVTDYFPGEIPYVSSGNYDNAVYSYCEPLPREELEKGNCISVSPVDGSTFYQPVDFLGRGGGGSSIILLYNDHLNEYNGLFISAVIRSFLTKRYAFGDMGNNTTIKKEKIKLPQTDDGKVDWKYMESFILNRVDTSKSVIRNLGSII